jgi:hypothetical protein
LLSATGTVVDRARLDSAVIIAATGRKDTQFPVMDEASPCISQHRRRGYEFDNQRELANRTDPTKFCGTD